MHDSPVQELDDALVVSRGRLVFDLEHTVEISRDGHRADSMPSHLRDNCHRRDKHTDDSRPAATPGHAA